MTNTTSVQTVTIDIQGMFCEGCIATVRSIISGYPAIQLRHLEQGKATFEAVNAQAELPKIRVRLEKAGYRVGVIKTQDETHDEKHDEKKAG